MFKSFWFYSMNTGFVQLQLLKSQLAIEQIAIARNSRLDLQFES